MKVCGKCLHDQDAHTPFNHDQKLMYCAVCSSSGYGSFLCDKEESEIEHKPTSLEELSVLQSKREFGPYKPKELKNKE